MKGERKIIQALNGALANELISINQTFLHSRMLNDWGIERFGGYEYKKSIKDMKQADQLIARILFLEGLPNMQQLGRLRIGENAADIVEVELALTQDVCRTLSNAIHLCEDHEDYVSRLMLVGILEDEENYIDWLGEQQSLIESTGMQNYIQSQS
ncbi:MAG: bacterioferritin [Rhodospirillaceae bacterium]|nr:bacterioferritin [Rhodospirillaceae bacterium]